MSTCKDCYPLFDAVNEGDIVELCDRHSAMEKRLNDAERCLASVQLTRRSANMPLYKAIEEYFAEYTEAG